MKEDSQETNWIVSSQPQQRVAGEELRDLAGNWACGITVEITQPFQYTVGPIVQTKLID